MAKFSTGLRTGMTDSTGARTALNNGFLKIYGGAVPADADAAVTGTLLATLSDNGGGGGLTFISPVVAATLTKTAAQVWKTNSITATGTATYWRFVAAADDGTLSTTAPRIQGTVGTVGADMEMSNTLFTAGQPWTLNSFAALLPTL